MPNLSWVCTLYRSVLCLFVSPHHPHISLDVFVCFVLLSVFALSWLLLCLGLVCLRVLSTHFFRASLARLLGRTCSDHIYIFSMDIFLRFSLCVVCSPQTIIIIDCTVCMLARNPSARRRSAALLFLSFVLSFVYTLLHTFAQTDTCIIWVVESRDR